MALHNWKIANLEDNEDIKFGNQKLMLGEIHFSLDFTILTVGRLQNWSCCHNLRIKCEFYCEVVSLLLFAFVLYILMYISVYIFKALSGSFLKCFSKICLSVLLQNEQDFSGNRIHYIIVVQSTWPLLVLLFLLQYQTWNTLK